MDRKQAEEFSPQVLDLFDQYVHGGVSRREFLQRAAGLALGGLTAAAVLESLSPNYAHAQEVPPEDPRIKTERIRYESKLGYGAVSALLARPAPKKGGQGPQKLPAVLVVHENRGLNPYIEDVARRLAAEGFLALAPDGLTSLGGYPGTDDMGRALQKKLDRAKLVEDFAAGAQHLMAHANSTGKVGVVGFCFGGMVANQLAVRLPKLAAAVPFYGRQPVAEDVATIKAPLLIHYAENDKRVNAGWTDFEAALKAHKVTYTAHVYAGTNHGFHNDTTPRYDETAAKLAWKRTLAFFREKLSG
ncbi:MAG: dienelactone hydrolase family protein [Planctomycetes bacterium]|nr:dienelactone hydrolase family protein [Planctomycetota bacterium]